MVYEEKVYQRLKGTVLFDHLYVIPNLHDKKRYFEQHWTPLTCIVWKNGDIDSLNQGFDFLISRPTHHLYPIKYFAA